MIVDVSRPSELRGVSDLVADAARRDPSLVEVRIVIGPGDYEGVVPRLDLSRSMPDGTIALQAADESRPPRLVDTQLDLDAGRVELSGLVLCDTTSDAPVLRCRATTGIAVEGCVLHHTASTAKSGGRLVEFISGASQGASVQVRRSWFIENGATVEGSALVGIDGFGPNGFDRVVFEDVAFLGNRVSRGIEAVRALEVQVSRCVIASETSTSGSPFVLVPEGVDLDMTDTHSVEVTEAKALAGVCAEAVSQAEQGTPPDVDRLRSFLAEGR